LKHAGSAALDALADMLAEIRGHGRLVERRPGVFYLKGRAFLHFHEDASGLQADLRSGAEWERFRVETAAERRTFLAALRRIPLLRDRPVRSR
jgi:hypothetical protein